MILFPFAKASVLYFLGDYSQTTLDILDRSGMPATFIVDPTKLTCQQYMALNKNHQVGLFKKAQTIDFWVSFGSRPLVFEEERNIDVWDVERIRAFLQGEVTLKTPVALPSNINSIWLTVLINTLTEQKDAKKGYRQYQEKEPWRFQPNPYGHNLGVCPPQRIFQLEQQSDQQQKVVLEYYPRSHEYKEPELHFHKLRISNKEKKKFSRHRGEEQNPFMGCKISPAEHIELILRMLNSRLTNLLSMSSPSLSKILDSIEEPQEFQVHVAEIIWALERASSVNV